MRKIVEFIIMTVIIVFGLVFVQNTANAEIKQTNIVQDYYVYVPISFTSGDSLTISYTMQVTQGPYIDVFFVDAVNFQYYKDKQEFYYNAGLSDEYTRYTSKELTITSIGDYYLIFDNTDIGQAKPSNDDPTAFVTYNVTAVPHSPNESGNTKTPGFEIIVVISAIALVFLWKRKRNYSGF
jgi:hypothetical protein